jgi:hypothetical protein
MFLFLKYCCKPSLNPYWNVKSLLLFQNTYKTTCYTQHISLVCDKTIKTQNMCIFELLV